MTNGLNIFSSTLSINCPINKHFNCWFIGQFYYGTIEVVDLEKIFQSPFCTLCEQEAAEEHLSMSCANLGYPFLHILTL